jgi:hypothetical protein
MARVVSGLAVSHSPLLVLGAEQWIHRALVDYQNPKLTLSDGRSLSYPQLLAEVGPRYEDDIRLEALQAKEAACNAELDRLAAHLEQVAPDVVVIVGDDQAELFNGANQPAIAIYHGDRALTIDKLQNPATPDWERTLRRAYMQDQVRELVTEPAFARRLLEGLIEEEIDIAACDRVEEPLKKGVGHAYGFIVKRLLKERPIPIVPVLLNTFFPPNVPTATRCFDIGQAMRRVIEAMPGNQRVTVVASGGLSHFVVDEDLDRSVLNAIQSKNHAALRALPRKSLLTGSSEILNWVMVAGVVEDLPVQSVKYLPLRRTPAGTGVGAGFVTWH